MSDSASTLAGIVAGYKAGNYTANEARRLLRSAGVEDDTALTILSLGAGIVG
jgi:hypothetical protein